MVETTTRRRQAQPAVRDGVAFGVLDELAGYALRRAQLRVTEAFDARLSAMGITTQRFSALVLIAENPGLKQTRLADIMGVARSGVTAIVDVLESQALIERRPAPDDARAFGLFVTPEGERRLPRIIALVRAHDAEVMAGLSEGEIADLRALLERVAREGDIAR